MFFQNVRIAGIHHGGFGFALEEILRVSHEILVEGVLPRDHHYGGVLPGTSDSSAPLPSRHDRTGIPHQETQVQVAYVDAQFQGAGGNDRQKIPRGEACLDFPSFLGQQPGPVRLDAVRVFAGTTPGPKRDQFGHFPRLRVYDASQSPVHGRLQKQDRHGGGAFVGVYKYHVPFPPGGAAFGHGMEVEACEACGQLRRVGHGGGTKDENRFRPVGFADPQKPSENLGHVGPHDPPVGMHFVHDHVFQLGKKIGPPLVVRKKGQMKHLGVGHQHVGGSAPDLLPLVLSGVSVVYDGGGGRFGTGRGHLLEGSKLVLRQGLQRKQVQCSGLRVGQDAFDRRKIVDQGFSARGRGGDNDVFAVSYQVQRVGLVLVQASDAGLFQNTFDALRPRLSRTRKQSALPGQNLSMRHLASHPWRRDQGADIFVDVRSQCRCL